MDCGNKDMAVFYRVSTEMVFLTQRQGLEKNKVTAVFRLSTISTERSLHPEYGRDYVDLRNKNVAFS